MKVVRLLLGLMSASSLVLSADIASGQATSTGSGQDYPNKPIRIATSTAGGGSDFVTRLIAQGMSSSLGQPVVVENRGSGVLLYEFLAKAPPDGYGLIVTGGAFWITPLLQKMPYDVIRDFSPVSLVVREVSIVGVHPSLPVKSVKELIALAKARPGELNVASTSIGGPVHLSGELFKSMAGVNLVRVSYKGSAQAITGLIGGEIQLLINFTSLLGPHIKSGKIKGLAVTSAEPSALAPGLPTVAASGLPGYEVTSMTAALAPGKTPVPIINRLNQEIVRVINVPDVKERFLNSGVEPVGSTPERLTTNIKEDVARWGKVIKDADIKLE